MKQIDAEYIVRFSHECIFSLDIISLPLTNAFYFVLTLQFLELYILSVYMLIHLFVSIGNDRGLYGNSSSIKSMMHLLHEYMRDAKKYSIIFCRLHQRYHHPHHLDSVLKTSHKDHITQLSIFEVIYNNPRHTVARIIQHTHIHINSQLCILSSMLKA